MSSKHAFITGGAKRVGREIALHLARAGYNISIHYNSSRDYALQTASEIETLGVKCALIQGDLNDVGLAENLLNQANEKLGEVSLMVHNASLFLKDCLADVSFDLLQLQMNINCFAPIILTRAMAAQNTRPAQVICLLDGINSWSISPNFLSYSLSKKALQQFVLLQAASLAPNIRLNGIALGATLVGEMDGEEIFAKIAQLSPLKANSNPEQVCAAIDFLENTKSITGQIIALSNGFNLLSENEKNNL